MSLHCPDCAALQALAEELRWRLARLEAGTRLTLTAAALRELRRFAHDAGDHALEMLLQHYDNTKLARDANAVRGPLDPVGGGDGE